MSKLWGGRFTGATDPLMEAFNDSLPFDKMLWKVDIEGSQSYARALHKCGLLQKDELDAIHDGLVKVAAEWQADTFEVKAGDEDIHTANERRLTEIIGAPAGKLHTGRSRNDQVATDARLWLREEVDTLKTMMLELIEATVARSEAEIDLIMPGYTHLQTAQPIRWSHLLMSYAWMWQRDVQRLNEIRGRVNMMPLGSGSIAGHPFQLDRHSLCEDLNFTAPVPNSLDGVSDRDFFAELLFWCSMTMCHFSRLAEDFIIYSSQEFGFIKISDAYSTGSSLMPQKKNPDGLELLRGKTGRVCGDMMGFLVTLKGLPSTYNKDLQEDKEAMIDALNTLKACIPITCGIVSTLTAVGEKMKGALNIPMLTTDLADYLVRKGVPFRQAHHISGQVVLKGEEKGVALNELSLEELGSIHPALNDESVMKVWSFESSVEARNTFGGTSKSAVLQQCALLKEFVAAQK
eukprot:GFYU01005853.1.p1 GENE.GFYU01005853.1~~GFYU01005853.1.p1  ORF type:complete len:461 (+),score=120.82 GFYU01005853.1:192-1574(+)